MADLRLMSREELRDLLKTIRSISDDLVTVPHGAALSINRKIEEATELLEELLPGGFFTYCESCERPIGCDENSASDPEDGCTLCGDCIAKYNQQAA